MTPEEWQRTRSAQGEVGIRILTGVCIVGVIFWAASLLPAGETPEVGGPPGVIEQIMRGLFAGIEHLGPVAAVVIPGLAIYFLPSFIAHYSRHRQFPALFALNLIAGWTFVGWVVALVWALIRPAEPRVDS